MSGWANQVRTQIDLLIDQIVNTRALISDKDTLSRISLKNYYSMLDELYSKDLVLAQVRDDSDLLLRIEGEAFSHDPKLQLVSAVFTNVTNQVTDLTKAILGLGADGIITPKSVDLGLSGIARGSLYFGLKAQTADDKSTGMLQEIDTLYVSTKRALEVIDDVSHVIYLENNVISIEEISEIVTDAKIRDAAMVAVQRLSPSGRMGIDSVSISGHNDRRRPAELNSGHRKAIRESLAKPVIRGEEIELEGYVREIDLDSRRFDLRGIANEQLRDVRCAYRTFEGVNPRKLLGAKIRARGLVERADDDIPRLMSINSITILREASDDLN